MRIKKKLLLSPLVIVILIIIFGVTAAGAAIFIGAGSGTSTSIDLQKGLVGWWKMDGDAKDATPSRNHGTVTGAVLANDRKGQAQKAYGFNGSSNYISATQPFAYSTTADLSISVWASWNSAPAGAMAMVAIGESSSNYIFLHVRQGQVGWRVDKTSATERRQRTTTAYSSDTWHHIVMTKVGNSDIKIYIDGVEDATREAQGSDSPNIDTSTMSIGRINTGVVTLYFQGQLDDTRVYNRALTSAEITALYDSYNPGIVVSDLQKGLVGQWKMDGNAKDATPSRNHGTVTGATLVNDRKGQALKAYSFNGTSDFIDVGDVSNFSFTSGGMSASAWIYASDTTSRTIVSKYDITTAAELREYLFYLDSGGALRFIVYDESADATIGREYSGAVSTGVWHHVIATYDGTTASTGVKLYLDGVQVDDTTNESGVFVAMEDLALPVRIGSFPQGSGSQGQFFNGSMDDVRIYNRALTSAEISSLYDSYNPSVQISDLQKGLVGNWKFDGNAKDATPQRNHGSVTGATLTTDRKGQASKAYNFVAASSQYILTENNPAFNIPSTLTVSAWVYYSGAASWRDFFSKYYWDSGPEDPDLMFVLAYSNACPGWQLWYGPYPGSTFCFGDDLRNQWAHVVVTYDSSLASANFKTYQNGVAKQTANYAGIVMSSGNNRLIIGSGTDSRYWNGSIDDVRVYNRVLSATEVMALYESY